MRAMLCLTILAAAACPGVLPAAESPAQLPPATVAQLKRMEPLSVQKVQVFVDAGQLTPAQGDLVCRYVGPDGVLRLPQFLPPPPPPAAPPVARPAPLSMPLPAAPAYAGNLPRRGDGSLDVIAYLRNQDLQPYGDLAPGERQRLEGNLNSLARVGPAEREAIRRDLRAAGPAADPLIAASLKDPVDLALKASLWRAVAGPHNPRAAGWIAVTHEAAIKIARPVLIPYAKDIGGLIVRRRDGAGPPAQLWYSSRELRDLIVGLEESISYCTGPRAASYLMDYYAVRYSPSEAPMRDSDRDRDRLLTACGGTPKDFDDGDPRTWGCALSPLDRVLIAERLVPHLNSHSGDVREIARYSLLVVNGQPGKRLSDLFKNAHKDWPAFERWWAERREQMLVEVR